MDFYVIPNMTRENAPLVTKELVDVLSDLGCKVYLDESLSPSFCDEGIYFASDESIISQVDRVISVGGDGSFINAAKIATKYKKPIICVNAGKLAYLACLERDELSLLENVIKG